MNMDDKKLLEESLIFINENPECLAHEVPQHLIDFWMTNNFRNEDLRTTDQWSVFMYISFLQKRSNGKFEIEKLERMQHKWQILLSIISTNNLINAAPIPFKIFDFEQLNKIRINEIIK